MKIAYLLNKYPRSRRSRCAARSSRCTSWASRSSASPSARPRTELIDEADIREKARTRVLLAVGATGLIRASLRTILTRPLMFARALKIAYGLGRRSGAG